VVTGQAAKRAGTRAVNVVRSAQGADAALEKHHIQTAEQIVAVLGTMKGAAMKLGQILSVLDVGLVPDENREEFQRKLAALRATANWHRIAREWIYDDPPVAELGRQEAEFFASAGA
jgi:predicted unusual protein kinase regulating ubiquinone biosynthesis (AarF/ABC1/UbiB family)